MSTGVVASAKVVTTAHSIEDGSDIAFLQEGEWHHATVRFRDEDDDIAVLTIDGSRLRSSVHVREQPLSPGDPIEVVHVDKDSGNVAGCVQGAVESVGNRQAQTSAPVEAGDSGSPALDRDGQLIGIVVSRGSGNVGSLIVPLWPQHLRDLD